ncbi:Efflux ABC transporter, permease/ATP-binding protein [Azospirillum argentinense]|uniref:ABC transmembrane type-1 domain-containing protein n=1 Tax=Azospirillum argentinense TaxID=2970906 RepID=A0A5B0KV91_9PROT|nr:Efflux ABC transporter, permease/ATP-binding protein [Azospirillum argentinense]
MPDQPAMPTEAMPKRAAALSRFLRDVWTLTRPYWSSEERWAARGLLAAIVALNLGVVFITVELTEVNGAIFNALQEKDQGAFVDQLLLFGGLALVYIAVAVYRLYLNQMLQIRWRRWLTDRCLGDWMEGQTYYRLQLAGTPADNPDQRIAEDLRGFVQLTLSLSRGLLTNLVTLVSFLAMLWSLSGTLSVALFGVELAIPGYMVWVALAYAVVGTWLTHRIGRPLARLSFDQQKYEADFRFALVRLRENAESVALQGGEAQERRGFASRFARVVDNWWDNQPPRRFPAGGGGGPTGGADLPTDRPRCRAGRRLAGGGRGTGPAEGRGAAAACRPEGSAGGARAGHRPVRLRQEHAVPRTGRHLAVRARAHRLACRGGRHASAAEALYAHRQPARRRHLSRGAGGVRGRSGARRPGRRGDERLRRASGRGGPLGAAPVRRRAAARRLCPRSAAPARLAVPGRGDVRLRFGDGGAAVWLAGRTSARHDGGQHRAPRELVGASRPDRHGGGGWGWGGAIGRVLRPAPQGGLGLPPA